MGKRDLSGFIELHFHGTQSFGWVGFHFPSRRRLRGSIDAVAAAVFILKGGVMMVFFHPNSLGPELLPLHGSTAQPQPALVGADGQICHGHGEVSE